MMPFVKQISSSDRIVFRFSFVFQKTLFLLSQARKSLQSSEANLKRKQVSLSLSFSLYQKLEISYFSHFEMELLIR